LEGWNIINSFVFAQKVLDWLDANAVIQLYFVMQMLAQQFFGLIDLTSFHFMEGTGGYPVVMSIQLMLAFDLQHTSQERHVFFFRHCKRLLLKYNPINLE